MNCFFDIALTLPAQHDSIVECPIAYVAINKFPTLCGQIRLSAGASNSVLKGVQCQNTYSPKYN
jgi:hypothetical protein